MGIEKIKLILRAFCSYNKSDTRDFNSDDDNIYPEFMEIDKNNGYDRSDTIHTAKKQIYNF